MNGGSGIKKSRVLTEEINQKLKTFDVSSEGTWLHVLDEEEGVPW